MKNLGKIFCFILVSLLCIFFKSPGYILAVRLDYSETLQSGLFYRNQGDLPTAIKIFELMLKEKDKDSRAAYELGLIYEYHLEKTEKAEEYYRLAVEIDNTNYEAWTQLGNIYGNYYEKFKEGEKILNKAIEHKADYGLIYLFFGDMYVKQNKILLAQKSYEKGSELDPQEHEYLYRLGELFYSQKDYLKAKEYFKKAVAINPDCDQAYYRIALICKEEKQYLLSIEYFKKAIECAPRHSKANPILFYKEIKAIQEIMPSDSSS